MIKTKKKPLFGNKRSKSMHKTKRKFFLNIQKKKIWSEKEKKLIKIKISNREFRTIKKKFKF